VSTIKVTLVFSNDEFLSALANRNVQIPLPMVGESLGNYPVVDYSAKSLDVLREWFFSQLSYTVQLRLQAGQGNEGVWAGDAWPSFGLYKPEPSLTPRCALCNVLPDQSTALVSDNPIQGNRSDDIGVLVAQSVPKLVYRFTAERFNMGEYGFGSSTVLKPRAENLPEVQSSPEQSRGV
jgi:hypothetical protein